MSAPTWSSVRSRARVRRMLGTIARAHVAVLADVARDHPLATGGSSVDRVDGMVGTEPDRRGCLAQRLP